MDNSIKGSALGQRTIVYQSFRLTNVPGWIERAMAGVKLWAELKGYDYLFIDDSFFHYAPDWYRAKVKNDVLLVSDLSRLMVARDLLGKGYDRAVWVDADVVIFDPAGFEPPVHQGVSFSEEIWVQKYRWFWRLYDMLRHQRFSPYFAQRNIANFVTVFTTGSAFLDFYIEACERIVRERDRPDRWDVGTKFLTALHAQLKLPLVPHAALFSPYLLEAIALNNKPALRFFMKKWGRPVYAANLCFSKAGETFERVTLNQELFDMALNSLVESRGALLNNLLHGE